jgi:glutathione S-transferase
MVMDLYFAPLACSMASRIALYEAGAEACYILVDQHAKKIGEEDFWPINPMGMVPVLRTDEGRTLTENPAVLSFIADRFPEAGLNSGDRHAQLQWLSFIASELHKAVFLPLLVPGTDEAVKAYAAGQAELRLRLVERHLAGRDTVLERFTIVDSYLFTVLNWARLTKVVDLEPWPGLRAYLETCLERPALRRAFQEEFDLYQEVRARRAAA